MLNEDQILELAVTLGSATKALIREAVEPLTARITQLEAAPGYLGVYELRRAYKKGSFVTSTGGVWAAMCDTQQKPGDGPDWQLAVRAGRDGRDLR